MEIEKQGNTAAALFLFTLRNCHFDDISLVTITCYIYGLSKPAACVADLPLELLACVLNLLESNSRKFTLHAGDHIPRPAPLLLRLFLGVLQPRSL